MREAVIQAEILAAIGALPGVYVERRNAGLLADPTTGRRIRAGVAGVADVLAVVDVRAVALEVKTDAGRQSAVQRTWQRAWEAAGGVYAVVRSAAEALAIVEEIKKATQCEKKY